MKDEDRVLPDQLRELDQQRRRHGSELELIRVVGVDDGDGGIRRRPALASARRPLPAGQAAVTARRWCQT